MSIETERLILKEPTINYLEERFICLVQIHLNKTKMWIH